MMTEKNAVLKHQRGREGYHNESCRQPPRVVVVLGISAQVDYVMAE